MKNRLKISKAHDRKHEKYRGLVSDIVDNGFACDLTCFEVGSRGLITPDNVGYINKVFSFFNIYKSDEVFRDSDGSQQIHWLSCPVIRSGMLDRSRLDPSLGRSAPPCYYNLSICHVICWHSLYDCFIYFCPYLMFLVHWLSHLLVYAVLFFSCMFYLPRVCLGVIARWRLGCGLGLIHPCIASRYATWSQ